MSIYRRRKWYDAEGIARPSTSGKAAATAGAPPKDSAAGTRDWSKHRRAMPLQHLLPASRKWLELLPPEVVPRELATHFPRIVNILAAQWNNYAACQAYFADLLVDRRGGRRGFPAAVTRELEKLRDFWYSAGER